jgi:hypothetical protein
VDASGHIDVHGPVFGRAFQNCAALKTAKIMGSATSIDGKAFSDNVELHTVTFEDGLLAIGEQAMEALPKLKAINLPGRPARLRCPSKMPV